MKSSFDHLAHAANRVAHTKGFLGNVFASYSKIEQISDDQIIALLDCSRSDYLRLSLCKTPLNPSIDDFQSLALFSGANPIAIAQIIRKVEAIEAIHAAADAQKRSMLLAARERGKDSEKDDSE